MPMSTPAIMQSRMAGVSRRSRIPSFFMRAVEVCSLVHSDGCFDCFPTCRGLIDREVRRVVAIRTLVSLAMSTALYWRGRNGE